MRRLLRVNKMLLRRLKDLREDNDLTIIQMANILNISKSNYGRWETDENIIPAFHLNNLCNYFNVSMDYITGLSKSKENNLINKKLNKEIIGTRLKEFRNDMNLTQTKLASVLNTSHSTISAYENGKRLLLVSFAYDIARKYNISLDWLYGRSNEKYLKNN